MSFFTSRTLNILLGAAFLTIGTIGKGQAASLTGNTNGGPGPTSVTQTIGNKTYVVSLKPLPVTALNAINQPALQLLQGKFPKWTFNQGAAAPGSFNILQYEAFATNKIGGANFTVLYDDQVAKARTDYSWIQIGQPDDWGSYGNKSFVDNKFSNFPFYANYTPLSLSKLTTPANEGNPIWKDTKNYPSQNIQNPAGGGKVPAGDLLFVDTPFCSLTCADKDGHADLILDLFLVSFEWNGKDRNAAGGTVTIHDGLRWGVQIDKTEEDPDGKHIPTPALLPGLLSLSVATLRKRKQAQVEAEL